MSYSYDLTAPVGVMRAIIPDNDTATHVFDDEELDVFLAIEGGSIKRGAALALETIASNEALVLKVVRLLDIQTDGAKVADALLKRAALLRKQAEDDEAAQDGAFDIAEMVITDFQAREHAWNQIQRRAL